ncbi:putative tricarboxylic transport membrane protein [Fictibacillus solisalsi]|uniref:Putative tricarboxylic transport membrane protein n=1 Tax=Fictibacillus solisalsi TaxID=459525 RepID=A0A1G9XN55_9BACL|nr:tripartite tricarboxylate transporter substrate binding protein [Fictibacillus solisalsi]SDM98207.1 putative tricarboxylic transport membrane protein [Fictibacillus solisalsi]
MKGKYLWSKALLASALSLGLVACSSGANGTDKSNYPEKAITVVAPSGAGGGWDLTARSLVKVLGETKIVDQTMTVENKPGGGGTVFMAQYATKDKKNDFKLFVNSPPILVNNLKSEGNSPFGFKDTTPLAQLTKDYGAVAVKADSKFNSLKEVLDQLKKDPKSLTVAGGSAPGSMDHLVAILPAYKAGIDPKAIKYVAYDGGGEAVASLLGGNCDVIATDVSSLGEYLKSGKIKLLAVESPERLAGDFKDVPTLKEQGIDAEFVIWRGIFGPKEMTPDAKKYWEQKLKKLSGSKEWKAELERNRWEADYKDSKVFASFLKEQETQITDMLKSLGMEKK